MAIWKEDASGHEFAIQLVHDLRDAANRLSDMSYTTGAEEVRCLADEVEETFVAGRCPYCGKAV
jgi:hypothetical protein